MEEWPGFNARNNVPETSAFFVLKACTTSAGVLEQLLVLGIVGGNGKYARGSGKSRRTQILHILTELADVNEIDYFLELLWESLRRMIEVVYI